MQKTEQATCKKCDKTEVINLTEDGYLPDPRILRQMGWYWSDNDDCWYCTDCEGKLVSEMMGQLMDLCNKKGVKVYDLHGNPLNEHAENNDNDESQHQSGS